MGAMAVEGDDRPIGRPQRRLLELSLLSLLAIVIALITTLHLPIADIKVERYDNARIILTTGDEKVVLPRETPLRLIRADGVALPLRIDALIDGIGARGDRAAKRAWWSQRGAIAAALHSGPVALRFADGRRATATIRPRRLSDLTGGFWAALATGFAALLCGTWVLVLRPRNSAARTFAVMSLGLFGVGCTLAAGHDPLLLGEHYRWLMLLNHACALAFAAAILILFCRFPTPILGAGWTRAIGLGCALVVGSDALDLSGDAIQTLFAAIAVAFALFVLLLAAQAWAVRDNPVGAAAMRLIGFSAILSSALFVGAVILPMLIAGAPLVSEAIALPLLLIIYGGLGAAIARTRLFSVDGWAFGLLLSVCAAIAVTAADVAILATAAGSRDAVLPFAIAAVCLIYLPLRLAISRQAARRRDATARLSLGLGGEIAFARDSESRTVRWRNGLMAIFEALEANADPAPADRPLIAEDGISLRLPPVDDMPGIVLRYAQRGARNFDAIDLDQARALIDAVSALSAARDAYMRGVARERARITQDLHDDVSARLLTSLHRQDAELMRKDVREAMADIRAIVAGTAEGWRPLEDVLADMRFETMNRLETHDIALDWPVTSTAGEPIDQATARHLISILRELVSNVVRHARATRVSVAITVDASRLHLRITDDGVGIAEGSDWGNGLSNSARRIAWLDGRFHIRRGDTGTTASLDVGLHRAPPAGTGDAATAREREHGK
ncbi:sensor histidine kinase [Sphingomonas sp.]|uniref:sensor histidine kinase n=1 Tax=Sphingomonas sp. TaxID=28214 RepID=UPI002CB133EB|nr:ATP-binding protein [Sphingomonas sp.]HWK36955.1 ATP-binding protein [Sphingomonas sp.]